MAVKKPTTKPKAKTTKATKVVKKSVAVSANRTKKVETKKLLDKLSFMQLHRVSVLAFVVLLVLVFVRMNSSSYELTVSYLTKDALGGGALVPAYRHLIDVPYKYFLAAILVLSTIFPLLLETKLKKSFAKVLSAKTISWGWLEKGVLQALLTVLVAYLLGFQDVTTIKLIALVVIAANLFGWIAERQHNAGNKAAAKTSWVGVGLVALVLLMLGGSLVFTHVYGQVRASWYDYAAFASLAFGLLVTRLKQQKYIAGRAGSSYEHIAKTYLLVGSLTTVATALIVIIGLSK